MSKFKIIVTLFIFCYASSCKNEIAEEIPILKYHIPQDIADYLIFKPGSYWVYKDNASGLKDSINIIMDSIFTLLDKSRYYSGASLIYADYMNISYYEDIKQQQSSFLIRPGWNISGLEDYTKYYITPFTTQFPFYNPSDTNNPEIDYSSSYYPNKCQFIEEIPYLNINDSTFTNVVEFRNTHLNIAGVNNYYSYHLYARHVGLIQFSDSTHTFKLIRYHLN